MYAGFLQFEVSEGLISPNLDRVRQGVASLPPRQGDASALIVLPELWAGGFAYDRLADLAQETPALLAELTALARAHRLILAGSLPEAVAEADGTRYYNTLFVTGPEGVLGARRKQELFAPMGEEAFFSPAALPPRPLATSAGLLGAMVCYDLRFADIAARQARQGAEIFVVAAQWPAARSLHWQTLLRSRAIENQALVIAANRCGTGGQGVFAGASQVVAPDGGILARAGAAPESTCVFFEEKETKRARRLFNTAAASRFRDRAGDKIVEQADLILLLERRRRAGGRIVFTNGCFDLLHPGHVSYLEEARRQGDCLVVGLNSDRSVRVLKGPTRPVNDEQSRALVLAGLGAVDYVVVFDEDTPERLIGQLLPDVLVKGADWSEDRIAGADAVKAAGGRVARIPLVPGASTTAIVRAIQGR